jgi:hypothetical protein
VFSRISFVFCRLISIKKKLRVAIRGYFSRWGRFKANSKKEKEKKTNPATCLTHLMSLCFIIRLSSGNVQIVFSKKCSRNMLLATSLFPIIQTHLHYFDVNLHFCLSFCKLCTFFNLFEINMFTLTLG